MTIVSKVKKQWDYCCHILICMTRTIVHLFFSCFTLFANIYYYSVKIMSLGYASNRLHFHSSNSLCCLTKIEVFDPHWPCMGCFSFFSIIKILLGSKIKVRNRSFAELEMGHHMMPEKIPEYIQ